MDASPEFSVKLKIKRLSGFENNCLKESLRLAVRLSKNQKMFLINQLLINRLSRYGGLRHMTRVRHGRFFL